MMTQEQLDNWFTYHAPVDDEQLAEVAYNSWRDQPGWVPWVVGGNSDKQDQARRETRGHGTAPKYAAIRAAENNVILDVTATSYEGVTVVVLHDRINAACKHFAQVINSLAPDSDDKKAAIRCVRLARNLFNEWAAESSKPTSERHWTDPRSLFVAAELELCKARMQANSAVALDGK